MNDTEWRRKYKSFVKDFTSAQEKQKYKHITLNDKVPVQHSDVILCMRDYQSEIKVDVKLFCRF